MSRTAQNITTITVVMILLLIMTTAAMYLMTHGVNGEHSIIMGISGLVAGLIINVIRMVR